MAPFGNTKAFELTETGFVWIGDYDISADEVLAGVVPKANKLVQAKKLLLELAEGNKTMPSKEIFEIAEEEKISKRTLENAKKDLNVHAKKMNNTWYWYFQNLKKD